MSYDDERSDRSGSKTVVPLRPKQVTEVDIEPLSAAEIVLLQGDLSILSAQQRVEYYAKLCESVGLNPLTKPFDYIVLNGKLTLYAKKDCTDQLRSIHGISVERLERESTPEGTYDVTAYGRDRYGRTDSSLGSVPIQNLRGEALSNAKMKAETKAKRRLTLSLAGLGFLDEVEVAAVPSAQAVVVDELGQVLQPEAQPKTLAAVVSERLSAAPEQTPAAQEPTNTAPDAPGAPEGNGEAPGEQEQEPVAVAPAEDVTEDAKAIFAEDLAPGLTFDEIKRFMKERHVFQPVVLSRAKAMFGTDATVADLSDQQRYALWEAVLDDLRASS